MNPYTVAANINTTTPQDEPIPGQEHRMVANSAGGFVYTISPMEQFRRFLILGSEGGSYYASERKLTRDNAQVATALFNSSDGPAAVQLLTDVSTEGVAPKVSPILFALALAFTGTRATKQEAKKHFTAVVRTHSHLLEFVSYADALRGWGRTLRSIISNWYNTQPSDKLTYQLVKYKNRSKWTTCDVLRMAHPVPPTKEHDVLYNWAVNKKDHIEELPELLEAHYRAMEMPNLRNLLDIKNAVNLITDYGLTREMIPNTWLDNKIIWEALLEKMPMTAMIRNLGKMTTVELLEPMSLATKKVINRLHNVNYLHMSKIHPFSVLLALTTYKSGRGVKGKLYWNAVQPIVDALNDAFYTTFKNVKPTGQRIMLALDISASMMQHVIGTNMSCYMAEAALALVTANIERDYMITGFTSSPTGTIGGRWSRDHAYISFLNISPKQQISEVLKYMSSLSMGGTDCSLPMRYAARSKLSFDAFVIYTDNETWSGNIHPVQALAKYQDQMGIPSKLIVVAFAASNFSIADPYNPNMLDVVGFDASGPTIISDFIKGII